MADKKFEHKTNRGSMFENDKKTEDRQPDFKGEINVNGQLYWISGWKEVTTRGTKRLSLSVQEKQQEERAQSAPRQQFQQRRAATW